MILKGYNRTIKLQAAASLRHKAMNKKNPHKIIRHKKI